MRAGASLVALDLSAARYTVIDTTSPMARPSALRFSSILPSTLIVCASVSPQYSGEPCGASGLAGEGVVPLRNTSVWPDGTSTAPAIGKSPLVWRVTAAGAAGASVLGAQPASAASPATETRTWEIFMDPPL
jgi:hypothetical protein